MKKTIFSVIFAATALCVAPGIAAAKDFVGPRVEVTAGYDDVMGAIDTTDVVYGAAVGYDFALTDTLRLGAEVGVDNPTEHRTFNAAARLGFVVSPNLLLYGKVGYANIESVQKNLVSVLNKKGKFESWKTVLNQAKQDGVRLAGGAEFKIAGPLSLKAEYRYTDADSDTGQSAVVGGAVLRF